MFHKYTLLNMSEMDSTINRLLPLLYANLAHNTCDENVIPEPATEPAVGLFDRMMRFVEDDEEDDDENAEYDCERSVTLDEDDNLHITIDGETGAMTFSEPLSDMNYMCSVSGGELLSRISELSMEIHHDDLYTGDYVRLYELLTNLVTNL
jgi:hypothetical protein